MVSYCKGTIIIYSKLEKKCLEIGYISHICKDIFPNLKNKTRNEKILKILDRMGFYYRNCGGIHKQFASKELDDVFKDIKLVYQADIYPIIYEKFTDGSNVYGRELHSRLVFPIATDKSTMKNYLVDVEDDKVDYPNVYLTIFNKFFFDKISKLETLIINEEIANNNEVLEYKNMFNKGFNKVSRKKKFIKKLQTLYNKNVFTMEVKADTPKLIVREKASSEVSIMENIEYLLQKLEKINFQLFNQYTSEYENILNNNNTLTLNPLSLQTLIILESKIEMSILFDKKDANSILSYINELKGEYLNNILKGSAQKTSLTLAELNKINELFLKTKSEYSLLEQRKVLKNIAFLYLMEVKENITDIDINELKNSYFADNLKSIIINIKALSNLGLIKSDLIIDLSSELTVLTVLEIIKRIEFSKVSNDDIKEKILKL